VVGEGQRVVGVLRDVDALRFVAHVARTAKRPTQPRSHDAGGKVVLP
jgi:hypothetical protein